MKKNGWMYQVFCGRWEGFSDKGKFLDQIKDLSWERLHALGCGYIYLLGLWDSRGPIIVTSEEGFNLKNVKNRVPSMMAIRDHTNVHPDLGSNAELLKLIKVLHKHQFKVIVDYIPNHTSLSHPWIDAKSDYYKYDNGNLIKEFSGDVAKLNYDNTELRDEMEKILVSIAEMGINGVRCDMAHLVPLDFWESLISKVKNVNSEFEFIAEAYPIDPFDLKVIKDLDAVGFDAIYDSTLFKNIENVIVENTTLDYIAAHLEIWKSWGRSIPIRYWGNHDDPPLNNRNKDHEKTKLLNKYFECILTTILMSSGIGLIYNGGLLQYPHRLSHHWKELLPNSFLETNQIIPIEIRKVLDLSQRIGHLDWSWESQDQLLLARASSTDRNYLLVTNWSNASALVDLKVKKGILRGLSEGQVLPSGKVEIFEY